VLARCYGVLLGLYRYFDLLVVRLVAGGWSVLLFVHACCQCRHGCVCISSWRSTGGKSIRTLLVITCVSLGCACMRDAVLVVVWGVGCVFFVLAVRSWGGFLGWVLVRGGFVGWSFGFFMVRGWPAGW